MTVYVNNDTSLRKHIIDSRTVSSYVFEPAFQHGSMLTYGSFISIIKMMEKQYGFTMQDYIVISSEKNKTVSLVRTNLPQPVLYIGIYKTPGSFVDKLIFGRVQNMNINNSFRTVSSSNELIVLLLDNSLMPTSIPNLCNAISDIYDFYIKFQSACSLIESDKDYFFDEILENDFIQRVVQPIVCCEDDDLFVKLTQCLRKAKVNIEPIENIRDYLKSVNKQRDQSTVNSEIRAHIEKLRDLGITLINKQGYVKGNIRWNNILCRKDSVLFVDYSETKKGNIMFDLADIIGSCMLEKKDISKLCDLFSESISESLILAGKTEEAKKYLKTFDDDVLRTSLLVMASNVCRSVEKNRLVIERPRTGIHMSHIKSTRQLYDYLLEKFKEVPYPENLLSLGKITKSQYVDIMLRYMKIIIK